jgi:hypothetical protein
VTGKYLLPAVVIVRDERATSQFSIDTAWSNEKLFCQAGVRPHLRLGQLAEFRVQTRSSLGCPRQRGARLRVGQLDPIFGALPLPLIEQR